MNSIKPTTARLLTGLVIGSATIQLSLAQVQHLSVTVPGGMPGTPIITGVQYETNRVTVTWDGPSGYYQLYQKVGETWEAVGAKTNLTRRAVVDTTGSAALFRVLGPAPEFGANRSCIECHEPAYQSTTNTAHGHAFAALKAIHQEQNQSCLPCHTVGFGLNTGFISETATPELANVQCENCHGPAGNHAANPDDPLRRPRVEIAAEVCGGCHSGTVPTYPEWKTSAHAVVTEDMNPSSRISSCGRCHSGSARLALLNGDALPVGDANVPIVCAVCHDAHEKGIYPAQLRNPVTSMKDYSLATSADFATAYDSTVNICGQCHNSRGATWETSGRPPHHSPQYNMLIGTLGELPGTQKPNAPAAHAFLEKQCVTCHMQTEQLNAENPPSVTGHSFRVEKLELCLDCHTDPEGLIELGYNAVTYHIDRVKSALDQWATRAAPAGLQKYGTLAWEYTVPGTLSTGTSGPSAADQKLVPERIKKARFNMYLVLHDGSYGVHNGPHAIDLLEAAYKWVAEEIAAGQAR